jgi:hypothetical protein
MKRILYFTTIIFLLLATANSLWNLVLELRDGSELYRFDSYVAWFIMSCFLSIITSVLILMYYQVKGYRVALLTGSITLIISTFYIVVLYGNLTSGTFRNLSVIASVAHISAIIVYGISLFLSNARKNKWLKMAGALGAIIGLVILSAWTANYVTKDIGLIKILGTLLKYNSIAWSLVNVLYVINFIFEIKRLSISNDNNRSQNSLWLGLEALAGSVLLCMIIVGNLLLSESRSRYNWQKDTAAQVSRLKWLAGGTQSYINNQGDSLRYLLIKPQDYDKRKKYPLVVCLPYGNYEASAAYDLSTDGNRAKFPAFIFVPYCPEGAGWGGIPGTPSIESLVYKVIENLQESGIDSKRRYVTGVSRGGYGTWEFITTRPDLFAAAIPVCGGGDPDLALRFTHIPVWAFHGANDKNVPVTESQSMIIAIRKGGGHPLYTEYPYGTHNIWEDVSRTPGLWKWMFSQTRK